MNKIYTCVLSQIRKIIEIQEITYKKKKQNSAFYIAERFLL